MLIENFWRQQPAQPLLRNAPVSMASNSRLTRTSACRIAKERGLVIDVIMTARALHKLRALIETLQKTFPTSCGTGTHDFTAVPRAPIDAWHLEDQGMVRIEHALRANPQRPSQRFAWDRVRERPPPLGIERLTELSAETLCRCQRRQTAVVVGHHAKKIKAPPDNDSESVANVSCP